MMPKAWYSMIDVRLIRPKRPCCMPRLKRRTATLGDGISTSTATSRRVTHGMRMLDGWSVGRGCGCVGEHVQDCHEHGEPELLRAEQRVGIVVPFAALDVVGVSKDDENPCHLEMSVSVV